MSVAPDPAPPPRLVHRVPVIGWIVRDVERDPDSIGYALVIVLTLLVLGVLAFGLEALTVLALVAVPVLFVALIQITWD